jgi:hypothetical protein
VRHLSRRWLRLKRHLRSCSAGPVVRRSMAPYTVVAPLNARLPSGAAPRLIALSERVGLVSDRKAIMVDPPHALPE